ncbi:hypothetical protein KY334_03385, partial [Candidatus Woesearchaeota archaeon]|nr:hypothetical protein [Candidatus Woesearchaeota archaeon]
MSLKIANLSKEDKYSILEIVKILKEDSDNLELILGYEEGVFVEFMGRVYFANDDPEFILEFPKTIKEIYQA